MHDPECGAAKALIRATSRRLAPLFSSLWSVESKTDWISLCFAVKRFKEWFGGSDEESCSRIDDSMKARSVTDSVSEL